MRCPVALFERIVQWRAIASVIVLLCGLLMARAATAVDLPIAILGRDVSLDRQDIRVLHQDRDGLVWAGTNTGLYVFDGVGFLRMDRAEGFEPSAVIGIVEDGTGDLWVATQAGMQVRHQGSFATAAPAGRPLLADRGQTLAMQANGDLLVVSHHRLMVVARQANERWTALPLFSLQQRRQDPSLDRIGSVAVQGDATWFGCGDELCRLQQARIQHFGIREGVTADAWQDILPARDGSLWVQGRHKLLRQAVGAPGFVEQRLPGEPAWVAGASGLLVQDASGNIVVGTKTGLLRLEGDSWKVYDSRQGIMPQPIQSVSTVLADRDGSLWMGVPGWGVLHWVASKAIESWSLWLGSSQPGRATLDRINALTLWTPDDSRLPSTAGVPSNQRWPLTALPPEEAHIEHASPDGSRWNFHFDGRITRQLPGASRPTTVAVLKNYIRGVLVSRTSRFWIYTQGGVDSLDPKTALVKHTDEFQTGTSCSDAVEDNAGRIWVACNTGLYRYSGQWENVLMSLAGSRQRVPITPERIAITPDGRLWVGTIDAQLLVSQISMSDKLLMQPANDVLQAGTRLDFLGTDKRGWLWAGNATGVGVFDGIHWSRLTSRDGLLLDEAGNLAFHADDDGSVWIATKTGLSHLLHPIRLLVSPVWQAEVVAADYGGKDLFPDSTAPFDQHKVATLHLATIGNSRADPVRYRYRLEGVDKGWHETGERSVAYPLAGPGTYRFEVQAIDVNHERTSATATWTFALTAPWWRSPWASLLALPLLIGAGATLAWRWRNTALIARNRQLEQTVDRRTAQLKLALHARNDLLARISHDLRSPLANIIECVNQWRAGDAKRDYPRIIEQSIWQQIGLIDDLLEFSRDEHASTGLEETAGYLHAFLAEIVAQAALMAERGGNRFAHRFDDKLPVLVKADFRRLRQVLLNLLGNAAKFTHGGLVEFEVAVGQGGDRDVRMRFAIRDNGIGIEEEKLESLLKPFVRGSNVEHREGKGLGLSIVAHWLGRMRSRLQAHRLDSGGSEFSFTVDLDTASESEADLNPLDDTSMDAGHDGGGRTIVVVDDQAQNRDMLCDLLDSYGFASFPAGTGREALKIVEEQRPAMVITDQYMDGMDGWGLLKELRRTHADLPVILCSATPPRRPAAHEPELDFDAALLKPVSVRQLLLLVAAQLVKTA